MSGRRLPEAARASGTAGIPRLRPDGQIEIGGGICEVERFGLPYEHDIGLLLLGEGGHRGRFVLTAAPWIAAVLAQRLAAVALADQAAVALSDYRHSAG